ncbi:MAG: hypothetical protein V7724_10870 [Sediminicola sp.]
MKNVKSLFTITGLILTASLSAQWTDTGAILTTQDNVEIGTLTAHRTLSVIGKARFGYGPLFIDWTNELSWNGDSNKWAGYIGFNAFRANNDTKDHYQGENKYTNKGVIEGSNQGFRFLYRNRIGADSDGFHPLPELMRLTNSGNLGIGTTDPGSYRLAVNGKIRAKEIKVEAEWADYVFFQDYPLPTLREVEEHIQKNGHLINIPSATEVKDSGIELGNMNRLLLEKIEELTLYILMQEKRLGTVEAELEAFKRSPK